MSPTSSQETSKFPDDAEHPLDGAEPYGDVEPPHPRQLSIFDALRAEDLRAYLARGDHE